MKEIPCDDYDRGFYGDNPIDRLMKRVVYVRFPLVKSTAGNLIITPVAEMDIGEVTDPGSRARAGGGFCGSRCTHSGGGYAETTVEGKKITPVLGVLRSLGEGTTGPTAPTAPLPGKRAIWRA